MPPVAEELWRLFWLADRSRSVSAETGPSTLDVLVLERLASLLSVRVGFWALETLVRMDEVRLEQLRRPPPAPDTFGASDTEGIRGMMSSLKSVMNQE